MPSSTGGQQTLLVCNAQSLRTSMAASDHSLKAKQKVDFTMSVTNVSASPCVVSLNAKSFSLKVYSGSDRIWSSADCSSVIPSNLRQLAPKQAMTWKLTWNGHRSAAGCKQRPEIPRAGTYWAIASFAGLPTQRQRMTIAD